MTASIGVVGLGYVGLKIYHEFSKYYEVKGYDISKERIIFLKKKYNNIKVDCDIDIIKNCNVYIVAVPTNVCEKKIPILSNLENATLRISKLLKNKSKVSCAIITVLIYNWQYKMTHQLYAEEFFLS